LKHNRQRKNKLILLVLISIILWMTTGCWNRRDPENLAFVVATGWDYDLENNQYIVTVQIVIPSQVIGNEGQSTGTVPAFWVHSAKGETPFAAFKELAQGSPRELFFAHNRLVLFTERIARRGIGPILDLITREHQLRLITRPGVVQGDLKTLLETPLPMESIAAVGLDKQIRTMILERSIFPVETLLDIYTVLRRPGQEMFIGRIISPGAVEDPIPNTLPITSGAALFSGDKMVGWASPIDVQGWNLALSSGFRTYKALKCPDDESKMFTVEFIGQNSKLVPILTEDDLKVAINIETFGRIQDFSCPKNTLDKNSIMSLEKVASDSLKETIESIILLSKQLRSDVIGIGNLIYRKYPHIWWDIEKDWYEIFAGMEIDINVNARILRTGKSI
jgi:spore germination protein KC